MSRLESSAGKAAPSAYFAGPTRTGTRFVRGGRKEKAGGIATKSPQLTVPNDLFESALAAGIILKSTIAFWHMPGVYMITPGVRQSCWKDRHESKNQSTNQQRILCRCGRALRRAAKTARMHGTPVELLERKTIAHDHVLRPWFCFYLTVAYCLVPHAYLMHDHDPSAKR